MEIAQLKTYTKLKVWMMEWNEDRNSREKSEKSEHIALDIDNVEHWKQKRFAFTHCTAVAVAVAVAAATASSSAVLYM